MPTSITAVSVVNWILRQHRWDEVTSFGGKYDLAVLDLVNEAMRTVLEGYDWKWNERSDLVIRCFPSFTTSSAVVQSGSTQFALPAYTGNWIGKNSPERIDGVAAYLAVTSDTTYGTHSFRVTDAAMSNTTLLGNMETPFPGTTTFAATATIYALEYALPSHVRSVVSVRDQSRTLRLAQCMSQNEFEGLIPRPFDTLGSDPELAILTGLRPFSYQTGDATNTGAFAETADVALTVYPAPGDSRFLNVTYQYRHPELAEATDTISGVPLHIVDDIKWIAYARSMLTDLGNEPDMGALILDRVSMGLLAKRQTETADPFRRRPLRSLDSISSRPFQGGRIVSPYGSTS